MVIGTMSKNCPPPPHKFEIIANNSKVLLSPKIFDNKKCCASELHNNGTKNYVAALNSLQLYLILLLFQSKKVGFTKP